MLGASAPDREALTSADLVSFYGNSDFKQKGEIWKSCQCNLLFLNIKPVLLHFSFTTCFVCVHVDELTVNQPFAVLKAPKVWGALRGTTSCFLFVINKQKPTNQLFHFYNI